MNEVNAQRGRITREQINQLLGWNGWQSIGKQKRNFFRIFFENGAQPSKYKSKKDVRDIKAIADAFKLKTEPGSTARVSLVLSVPANYVFHIPTLGEIQRCRERRKEEWIKDRDRRIKLALKKEALEAFCDVCGRRGDVVELGFARNGSIQCVECNMKDPILCDYKWEPLYPYSDSESESESESETESESEAEAESESDSDSEDAEDAEDADSDSGDADSDSGDSESD